MSVASERVREISQGNKVIGITNKDLFLTKKPEAGISGSGLWPAALSNYCPGININLSVP